MCLKIDRAQWDAAILGIWSGSIQSAQACLSQYLVQLQYMYLPLCKVQICLQTIVAYPQTKQLTSEEEDLVWKYRFYLSTQKKVSVRVNHYYISLDKSGYQVNIFLISQQKHMLWVLIRSTLERFF